MADVFNFYVQDDRSIQFNIAEPILLEDKDVTEFQFRIPKTLNGFDMSTWAWWFVYVNPKKEKYSYPLTLTDDEDEPDDYSVATFSINYGITEKEGGLQFALEVIDADAGGNVLHEWHTRTYHTAVIWTLQGNKVEYEEDITQDILSSIIEQIALNKARIDNIARLPEGSTTADAELIDIRVGANGETYPTAGDAVRGQISDLKEDLTDITEPTRNLWAYGDQSFSTSKLIELKNLLPAGRYCISASIISTDTDTTYCRAAFYKSDGTTLVVSVELTRGERTHAGFTANDNLYFVRLFASTNSSTSSGDTATWTNIQLEDGSIETKYIPPITAVDFIARNMSSAGSTVYISPTGSDDNNGAEDAPFATIQKAIDLGYKNICVKAGRYNQSVVCDDVKNLNIYADNNDIYNSEDPAERAKPILTNGEYFNTFRTDASGYKYFGLTSIPSPYRRVFIDHSLPPVTSGSRPSYNAGLWANHSDCYNDFKIKPVLSYAELSEDNTFYFDGTTVYFHVEDAGVTGVTVVGSIPYVSSFTGCDGLTLNGLRFEYAINMNLRIWNSNNVNVKNCDFAYTMLLDNVSTNFSNVRFENCLSYKARNDGFNCHYYGVSVYDNCNALYNYDDGESSHEYCEVIVHGGEYAYNGKGGHAPVNGCKFKCDSAYAHHNNYGFYMIGSEEFNLADIIISNSVALDNTTSDLTNSYYNTKLWNCVIGVTSVNSGTVTDLGQE